MSLNIEKYQALASLLEELRLNATASQVDALKLKQGLASLRQMYGQEIVPLDDEDWRVQSYRTEIAKQLRLLEIDVMFFQGARQSSTATARLHTIADRLTTLIQYCDAIVQKPENQEK